MRRTGVRQPAKFCVPCAGVSRFAIARWLHGKTQPRLHDFLALVEAISGRASDLVHALVSIDAVSELGPVHAQRAAAKRLAFDEPWSSAVLRVLETTPSMGEGAQAVEDWVGEGGFGRVPSGVSPAWSMGVATLKCASKLVQRGPRSSNQSWWFRDLQTLSSPPSAWS